MAGAETGVARERALLPLPANAAMKQWQPRKPEVGRERLVGGRTWARDAATYRNARHKIQQAVYMRMHSYQRIPTSTTQVCIHIYIYMCTSQRAQVYKLLIEPLPTVELSQERLVFVLHGDSL